MSDIKILHIADLHLDRKISHLTEKKAQIRKSEILLSLSNVLKRFDDCDLILISGDIFDGDYSKSTVSYVCNLFKEYKDKYFFIAFGNHDHLNKLQTREFIADKPNNVFVFGDCIDYVELPDLHTRIYGISFSSDNSYASLINGFNAKDDDYINLMVLHADVGTNSSYNPVSYEEIANSNLDYLALGHVHSFSGIKQRSNTFFAYPGVAEPCGFDETGECGVIYGTVSKNNCSLAFYPTSKRKYLTYDFDISEIKTGEELVDKLNSYLDCENLYRINFVGKRNFIVRTDIYSELLNCFYVEFCDSTDSGDNIFNYKDELSLRGKTAQYLLEVKEQYEPEIFDIASDILTEIMCGE